MSATSVDRPPDPAHLPIEAQNSIIIRKPLSLTKALSPVPYLISLALIATWIVGVFFGVGFFVLINRPETPVSRLVVGKINFGVLLDESPWLLQAMIRLDHLVSEPFAKSAQQIGNEAQSDIGDRDWTAPAPGAQNAVEINQQASGPAEPGSYQTLVELRDGAPSIELATTAGAAALAPTAPPQIYSPAATNSRDAAQSAHDRSSRTRHQRRPAEIRTQQPHAPVRAIQDVLQRHSNLFK
jgi:hypothetical protein